MLYCLLWSQFESFGVHGRWRLDFEAEYPLLESMGVHMSRWDVEIQERHTEAEALLSLKESIVDYWSKWEVEIRV